MATLVEETWNRLALPILEAVFQLEEDDADGLQTADIAKTAGLELDATRRELRRLYESGLVVGSLLEWTSTPWDMYGIRLSAEARRQIGQWPSESSYEALLDVLQLQIDNATDSDERTRLVRLRAAIGEVGQSVVSTLLAAYLKHHIGLP
ncbi:MAG: hypothetical protein M3285_02785 [Actinomycetota bacterium]|nr:hypothetical protein [Actinomycetota bacterium]